MPLCFSHLPLGLAANLAIDNGQQRLVRLTLSRGNESINDDLCSRSPLFPTRYETKLVLAHLGTVEEVPKLTSAGDPYQIRLSTMMTSKTCLCLPDRQQIRTFPTGSVFKLSKQAPSSAATRSWIEIRFSHTEHSHLTQRTCKYHAQVILIDHQNIIDRMSYCLRVPVSPYSPKPCSAGPQLVPCFDQRAWRA
jgi:hypothetical protein